MTEPKDYTHKGWLAVFVLIIVLVGVSLIPPCTIGGVNLRRANILSDLFAFERSSVSESSQVMLDEEEYKVDMEKVVDQIESNTLLNIVQTTFTWSVGAVEHHSSDSLRVIPNIDDNVLPVEDFASGDLSLLGNFYDKLLDGKPVRIAVMGDSFIEGDILTADLREQLQLAYGGSGAGFAPMASPLTAFRRTVKTQARGWTPYNIMQHRTTPESLRDQFYISGWVCRPSLGAETRWECAYTRRNLNPALGARILFVSRNNSKVEVVVNDSVSKTFIVKADAALRQVKIDDVAIRSLAFRVVEGNDGFIGYGALLGSDGVAVDNYSIRSNNGQAMFRTNPAINAQANAMLEYDLVVLQYGLNIMQQGIHNYANYGEQVKKMIAYARQCFPTAAILVMGVSDRSVRTDTGIVPMDAVTHMARYQRNAALAHGAAFWDTAAAMRGMGGIERFVTNGWAGKDYTHINYAGGRRIAHAMADSFHEGVVRQAKARQRLQHIKQMPMGIADSVPARMQEVVVSPIIVK